MKLHRFVFTSRAAAIRDVLVGLIIAHVPILYSAFAAPSFDTQADDAMIAHRPDGLSTRILFWRSWFATQIECYGPFSGQRFETDSDVNTVDLHGRKSGPAVCVFFYRSLVGSIAMKDGDTWSHCAGFPMREYYGILESPPPSPVTSSAIGGVQGWEDGRIVPDKYPDHRTLVARVQNGVISTGPGRYVPFRPILLGLLINTCVGISIAHFAFVGYGAAVVRVRKCRGLCLQCGYDLNHHAARMCPECGRSIENK